MNRAKPIFDLATRYRIEVRGRVNVEWLQSFGGSTETCMDAARQEQAITVLNVKTDQAGMVGLVRRLHGLGMTILKLQIVSNEGKDAQIEKQP